MYQHKKILGLITARGGSKSIPKKNIVPIAGKPMIAYSIEAAKKSKLLTRTILSCDDAEIIEISKKYGADVPFVRPTELAQDTSTHIEVVQHALKWLKENDNQEYDYLMILQPTSPLRTAEDIDECIKIAVDNNADSVMSMKELTDFSLKKIKKVLAKGESPPEGGQAASGGKDGVILPFFEDEGKWTSRRQDIQEKMYKRNCAVYLTKTELLMQGDLFGKVSRAYIMPEERSVDINTLSDFILAEYHLKYKK